MAIKWATNWSAASWLIKGSHHKSINIPSGYNGMNTCCYVSLCAFPKLVWKILLFVLQTTASIVLQLNGTPSPVEHWMVHSIFTISFWARDDQHKRRKRSVRSYFWISSHNILLYWIVISNLKTLKQLHKASELWEFSLHHCFALSTNRPCFLCAFVVIVPPLWKHS